MLTDQTGGFAIAQLDFYRAKQEEALQRTFTDVTKASAVKARARVNDLCEGMGLAGLAKAIGSREKLKLELFFSVKTRKPETPFRAIVPERHT